MSVILVTGSKGQLGSELSVLARSSHHQFVFADIDELDITNLEQVRKLFSDIVPAYCINCAAYTAVDKAETDEETAKKINVSGPANLAKVCNLFNTILIHISTDFVFDGSKNLPLSEPDEPNPLSVYGATKLEGEKEVLRLNTSSVIIRTSWLYSSFGNNFVKTMIRLGKERDEVKVIADQIGTPTYAADLATAILKIINKFKADSTTEELFGIYHYSNEGVASWYDFAAAVFEYANIETRLTPIRTEEYPTPAIRPKFSVMDKRKIKESFGVEVDHWRKSVKKCLELL